MYINALQLKQYANTLKNCFSFLGINYKIFKKGQNEHFFSLFTTLQVFKTMLNANLILTFLTQEEEKSTNLKFPLKFR